jgi:hypothetical protein
MQLRIRTYHPNNEVNREVYLHLSSCVLSPKRLDETQTLLFFDTEELPDGVGRELSDIFKSGEELFMRLDDVYVESPSEPDLQFVECEGKTYAEVEDGSRDLLYVVPGDIDEAWGTFSSEFSCPSRVSWGTILFPRAVANGLLIECETRDPNDSTDFKSAYIIKHNERVFDQLIMDYTREHGIGDRPCPNMTGT